MKEKNHIRKKQKRHFTKVRIHEEFMKKTLNKLGMLCYNSECFLPKIGKRTRMSTLNPSSHHHTRSHDQLFILESTVDL